jgi:hypothetical protein
VLSPDKDTPIPASSGVIPFPITVIMIKSGMALPAIINLEKWIKLG